MSRNFELLRKIGSKQIFHTRFALQHMVQAPLFAPQTPQPRVESSDPRRRALRQASTLSLKQVYASMAQCRPIRNTSRLDTI